MVTLTVQIRNRHGRPVLTDTAAFDNDADVREPTGSLSVISDTYFLGARGRWIYDTNPGAGGAVSFEHAASTVRSAIATVRAKGVVTARGHDIYVVRAPLASVQEYLGWPFDAPVDSPPPTTTGTSTVVVTLHDGQLARVVIGGGRAADTIEFGFDPPAISAPAYARKFDFRMLGD
jgi:hypothetical protein